MDMITLAAARKYVNDTASALGAVKGSPCTIKSITETDDGATVVFSWTGADGVEQTRSTFLPRGPQGLPGEKGEPGAPGKDGSGTVDTVAREQITALTEEIANKQGITAAQIAALDDMFKVCAYVSSADAAYSAFCEAFGISAVIPDSITYRPELEGIVATSTNAIVVNPNYWFVRTDYIPLAGYDKVEASFKINNGYGVAFFNDDKTIMPYVSVVGTDHTKYTVVDVDIPDGAAYCILSHHGGSKSTNEAPDAEDAYITVYKEGALS